MSKKKSSTGGVGAMGFISFSDVADSDSTADKKKLKSQYITGSTSSISVAYQGSDANLSMACKKLLKKDINTKLKSIAEVAQCITVSKEVDTNVVSDFMPYFTFAFSKLIYEDYIPVRSSVATIIRTAADVNRKAFVPYLDSIMGGWWQLMSDTSADVQNAYESCFKQIFPIKRQAMVIQLHGKSIFAHLVKNLQMSTTDLKTLTLCADEDLQEKHERVMISSFDGLRKLFERIPASDLDSKLFSEDSKAAQLDNIKSILIVQVSSQSKEVRRVLGLFIECLVEKYPQCLQSSVDILRAHVVGNVDESKGDTLDSTLQLTVALGTKLPSFYDKPGLLMSIIQKFTSLFHCKNATVRDKCLDFLLPFLSTTPSSKVGIFVESLEPAVAGTAGKKQPKVMKGIVSLLTEAVSESISADDDSKATSRYLRNQARIVESCVFLLLRKLPSSENNEFEANGERVDELLAVTLRAIDNILVSISLLPWELIFIENHSRQTDLDSFAKTLFVLHRASAQNQVLSAEDWKVRFWSVFSDHLANRTTLQLLKQEDSPDKSSATGILCALAELLGRAIQLSPINQENSGVFFAVTKALDSLISSVNITPIDNMPLLSELVLCVKTMIVRQFPIDVIAHAKSSLLAQKQTWFNAVLRCTRDALHDEQSIDETTQQLYRAQAVAVIKSLLPSVATETVAMSFQELLSCTLSEVSITVLHLLLSTPGITVDIWEEADLERLIIIARLSLSLSTSEEPSSAIQSFEFKCARQLQLQSLASRLALALAISRATDHAVEKSLVALTLRIWQQQQPQATYKPFKAPHWFILTIVRDRLRHGGLNEVLTSESGLKLAEFCTDHTYGVFDRLIALLFAQASNDSQSHRFIESENSQLATQDMLSRWEDVEALLLPLFPAEWRRDLLQQMREKVDSLFTAHLVSTSAPVNVNSWLNVAARVTALLSAYKDESESMSLSLFSASSWFDLNKLLSEQHVVREDALVTPRLEQQLLYWSTFADQFPTLFAQQLSAPLLVAVVASLFSADRRISSETQRHLLEDAWTATQTGLIAHKDAVIDYLLSDASPLSRESAASTPVSACEEDAMNALLQLLSSAKANVESSVREPLAAVSSHCLHMPLDSTLCSRGQRVWYIARKQQPRNDSSTASCDVSVAQVFESLVPATITGIHLENGVDQPYYSVSVESAEEPGSFRDIQTEWSRLLLFNSVEDASTFASHLKRSVKDVAEDEDETSLLSVPQIVSRMSRFSGAVSKGQLSRQLHQQLVYHQLRRLLHASSVSSSLSSDATTREEILHLWLSTSLELLSDTNREDALVTGTALLAALLEEVSGIDDGSFHRVVIRLASLVHVWHQQLLRGVTRLAHDTAYLIDQLTLGVVLLTYVASEPIVHLLMTKVLPAALTCLRNQQLSPLHQRHLDRAMASVLRSIWTYSGSQRLRASASSAPFASAVYQRGVIAGVHSWESEALSFVLAQLFLPLEDGSFSSSTVPIEEECDLLRALQTSLLGRTSSELAQLLSTSTLPLLLDSLTSEAFDSLTTTADEALEQSPQLNFSERRQSLLYTRRIAAGQLIDRYLAVGVDEIRERLQTAQEYLVHETGASSRSPRKTARGETEGDLEDEEEDTEEEMRRNIAVLEAIVGVDNHRRLENRFSINNVQAQTALYLQQQHVLQAQQSETSLKGENVDDGNDNEEDENDNDQESSDLASVSTLALRQQQQLQHSSTALRTRRLQRQMLATNDPLGALCLWLTSLQAIDAAATLNAAGKRASSRLRAQCGAALQREGVFTSVMHLLVHLAANVPFSPTSAASASAALTSFEHIQSLFQRISFLSSEPNSPSSSSTTLYSQLLTRRYGNSLQPSSTYAIGLHHLAICALYRTIVTLPAMTRAFWTNDCARAEKKWLARFVEERVRGAIVRREIALIEQTTATAASSSSSSGTETAANGISGDDFTVTGQVKTGVITASLVQDEVSIEISIAMPPSYPLKNVEVSCTRRIGVAEGRWRRWVLQMIQLLSLQDGAVVDAAMLWRANVNQELQGVEPCPICYCTLHSKTLRLPTLACPTCKHRFHPSCLHTWFKTSGKNKCVLCQQPIFM